jgi:acetate kinase
MGLTPMEGLVMGTRSGDVNPGLVLHLINALGSSGAEVDDLLNHRSGLLRLSGVSGDTRELQSSAQRGNARAQLALQCFAYRARKYIGAYAAALGGLDASAFSGGIGEHSPDTRAAICCELEFNSSNRLSPAVGSSPNADRWCLVQSCASSSRQR